MDCYLSLAQSDWKETGRLVTKYTKDCIWEVTTFLLTVDPGMWESFLIVPQITKITWERDWGVVHELPKVSTKEAWLLWLELREFIVSPKTPPIFPWESSLNSIQAYRMRSSCDRGHPQLSRIFPALSCSPSSLFLNLYHESGCKTTGSQRVWGEKR